MESLSLENLTGIILTKYQAILGKQLPEKNPSIETIVEEIIHYYEAIISCMPGNVYWLDKNGITIGGNKNVLDMFDMQSLNEFKGLTFEDMARIGNWLPETVNSFKKDTLEVIQTGKPKLNVEEPPIPHSDGRTIYFLTSRVPLYDHLRNVIGVVGISVDITELKNTQISLNKAKEQAEAANQLKTDFICNMEHDIRTPFSGIYSMTKILEEREINKEKKEWLSAIADCAKELLDYCNGILDFSKLEAGNMPLLAKKFNLHQLVNNVIAMEKPPAEIKGLYFITEYCQEVPIILISDPYRVQRILINLVSNAVKFTEKGFIKIKVKVVKRIDKKNIAIRISVEDTGIGISEESQILIYEKFNRLSPSNRGFYKGAGLGLTVIKQMVAELEGEIDIRSEFNKGTKFICTLPFKLPLSDNLEF